MMPACSTTRFGSTSVTGTAAVVPATAAGDKPC